MFRRAHRIREAIATAVNAQLISRKDNRVRLVAARGYPSLGATDACPAFEAATEATTY
jgi:hypothetical protein